AGGAGQGDRPHAAPPRGGGERPGARDLLPRLGRRRLPHRGDHRRHPRRPRPEDGRPAGLLPRAAGRVRGGHPPGLGRDARADVLRADGDGPGVEKRAGERGETAVRADVTRPDDVDRMVDTAYRRWGRLDVLFNNAGVVRLQPMLEVTPEEWDRVMNVNLR